MPTYEYICSKCGQQFDLVQSMKDEPIAVCPRELCPQKRWGKGKVTRAIGGGAGLIFKGSGFYITDYRSDKYKEAAKKDTATSAAATTSDSKSATPKAEPKTSKSTSTTS